jgi:hypothetical protein
MPPANHFFGNFLEHCAVILRYPIYHSGNFSEVPLNQIYSAPIRFHYEQAVAAVAGYILTVGRNANKQDR